MDAKILVVLILSASTLLAGCEGAPQDGSGNSAAALVDDAPEQGFVAANGRRFMWVGKAKMIPAPANVDDPPGTSPVEKTITSAEELALALRPHVLKKNGHEYTLETPDVELATRLLAGMKVAATDGHPGARLASDLVKEQELVLPYIIGPDNRTSDASTRFGWPISASGHYYTGCSATLIGPHTASIAAHCLVNTSGVWYGFSTDLTFLDFTPARDTSSPQQPFGSYTANTVAVPGAWISTHDWNYDYGLIDFSPDNPGFMGAGWLGTYDTSAGTMLLDGYPSDKGGQHDMWQSTGTVFKTSTYRRLHYLDIKPGTSGAGLYAAISGDYKVVGIQSTEAYNCFLGSCNYWNEAERFTPAVASFISSVVSWP